MSSENKVDETHDLNATSQEQNTINSDTNPDIPEQEQVSWPSDVSELHELLNNYKSENTALTDKLDKVMRAYAEADNKSKRAEKDKIDAIKFGPTKMARDMLEVADNFERALKTLPETEDKALKEIFEGLVLTEKSLHQVLSRFDVKQIDTENAAFDPNIHEAVTQVPVPDKKSGEIIDVIRKGYHIGERLLRPAQVVIVA